MLFRRAAALLPVLFVACTFPDYQFDDKRFNAQNGNGEAGEGGTEAGGKGGTTSKGGSSGKGGATAGAGGDAGEGGESGSGGSAGTVAGGASGKGGAAGSSGAAGTGGTSGAGGRWGSCGAGGAAGGGTGGASGSGGTAGGSGAAGATGGTSGGGGTGPAGTCTTNADCTADELCSTPVSIGNGNYLKCFGKNPAPGAEKAGAVCESDGDCESFACLFNSQAATKGVCTAACGTTAECAPNAVCFPHRYSATYAVRLCDRSCTSDAVCDPATESVCQLYSDPITDVVAFACLGFPPSSATFGEANTASKPCRSGVTIGNGANAKCTKPCDSAAECAPPFPACSLGPIGTPGGKTAQVKVCTAT